MAETAPKNDSGLPMSEQTALPPEDTPTEDVQDDADASKDSGFRDRLVGLCFLLAIGGTTVAWFFLLGWSAWRYLRP